MCFSFLLSFTPIISPLEERELEKTKKEMSNLSYSFSKYCFQNSNVGHSLTVNIYESHKVRFLQN